MSTEDRTHERLNKLHDTLLAEGQETAAQKFSANQVEQRAAATKKVLEVVSDTIDLADQIAADGNPHKQRLATLIKDRIVGAVEKADQAEGRGALEAPPFSTNSLPSETSSPDSTKALPQPAPKKRGRPPKSRS